MIHIAPSILAADFSRLGDEVRVTQKEGADRIHVDVMDGHFVPNLSMGPAIVKSLRPVTRLPLEVHLMVEEPARFVLPFCGVGADSIIAHLEVLRDPIPFIRSVRSQGKKVGLSIKPGTPVDAIAMYLSEIDLALCMTVDPGFGGQPFLPESPERIKKLRQLIGQRPCELEVDGGIEIHTAPVAAAAGANVLVVGTGIFRHHQGPAMAIRELKQVLAS